MSRCIQMLLLFGLAVLLPAESRGAIIDTRKDLPTLDYVWAMKPGDGVNLELYNETLEVYWIPPNKTSPDVAVSWNAPLWRDATQKQKGASSPITAPVLVIGNPAFRIKMTNLLPFQKPCTCADSTHRCTPIPPLDVVNGMHNLHYTNVHTHGLKVDVGKDSVPVPATRDVCANVVDPGALCATGASVANGTTCHIFSDDIFASVAPGNMTSVNTYFLPNTLPGLHWYHHHAHGSVAYLNPTSKGLLLVPDINPWQMFAPIGSKPFPDRLGVTDWRDWFDAEAKFGSSGNRWTAYQAWSSSTNDWADTPQWDRDDDTRWSRAGAAATARSKCSTFIKIIKEMPNFSKNTMIIESGGLWMRNNGDVPDDDTIPFIGARASPPSNLLYPDDVNPLQPAPLPGMLTNNAGRDFYPWNGVIQPTINLDVGRWKRWLLIGTHTMKWKDITIRQMPDSGSTKLKVAPECEMWLLGWDGVYFEKLPRKPMSNYTGPGAPDGGKVNNIVLGPATRADILVRCNASGTYVVASGAGPFKKNPLCGATHCELVGDSDTILDDQDDSRFTGNNWLNGTRLDSAVLAVLNVTTPPGCNTWRTACLNPRSPLCARTSKPRNCDPHPDLEPEMCRTRLELYHYLNHNNFPSPSNQQAQCYDIQNLAEGGGCRINGVELGNDTVGRGIACLNQGATQVWDYRGLIYHPFHLHETPVRTEKLPLKCLNDDVTRTNLYQEGDWHDTVFIPMCQHALNNESLASSEMRKFLATPFPPVPAKFNTTDPALLAATSRAFLKQYECLQQQAVGPLRNYCTDQLRNGKIPCADRWSVLHCHHLPHEDEGCIILTHWACPTSDGQPTCLATNNGACQPGTL